MKLSALTTGQAVRVRRGYSTRPARIDSIRNGKIGVTYTDIDRSTLASIPTGNRGSLLGASVNPAAILPAL
jgi:hypothetical protein